MAANLAAEICGNCVHWEELQAMLISPQPSLPPAVLEIREFLDTVFRLQLLKFSGRLSGLWPFSGFLFTFHYLIVKRGGAPYTILPIVQFTVIVGMPFLFLMRPILLNPHPASLHTWSDHLSAMWALWWWYSELKMKWKNHHRRAFQLWEKTLFK